MNERDSIPDASQPKPLTVSAAMALAKSALEQCTVTLVGEVSEVSNKPGYKAVYFTVKDTGASLPCMVWMNRYRSFGVELRIGMKVRLTGRFTLYAPKGRMNFDVFSLVPAGEGDLRQQVADRAEKLKAEGLMESARKRPVPDLPQTIGLVTSPRGAAVHDVLRTLRRRYPLALVVLAGVPVEGDRAACHLIEGLQCVVAGGAEVVLLVRGGGSFEDLMPFNDEALARAIASCPVPVVTGIGHEPDTSIADMVADLRASTPTAAAEAAAPDGIDLSHRIEASRTAMAAVLTRRIERSSLMLQSLSKRPVFTDPEQLYATDAQTIDLLGERLHHAIPIGLERDSLRLRADAQRLYAKGSTLLQRDAARMRLAASRLNDLSPLTIISRGYAMARTKQGAIVSSVSQASQGSSLSLMVADGTLDCTVDAVHHAEEIKQS